jgi:peptidoglycan/LPS O-acetylase OafA/YrhL
VDDGLHQIHALTSLRLFAAAMIVVLHANGHFGIPAWLPRYVGLGAGVSIFFVLSGFILTINYPELPTWTAVLRFWRNRFARLWPHTSQ